MAEKKEKQVKAKKGRAKGPKLVVGDFPYVSLMPANRLNAIEVEEAKAKWIKTVGAGVAIAVVISIGAFGFKVVHQIGFDNAKQDAATVEQSILQYSEVDRALTIKSGIEGDIIAGAGNAINWSDLHNRISRNLPQGASLTTFDVVTGGKVKDANSVSVFVNVSSTQPIDYAQILNSFGTVQGILPESLLIGDLTATGTEDATPIYSYPVAFTVDNTVMSQRWAYLTNPDAEAAKTQDSASEQDAAAPSTENSTETPEVTTEENE